MVWPGIRLGREPVRRQTTASKSPHPGSAANQKCPGASISREMPSQRWFLAEFCSSSLSTWSPIESVRQTAPCYLLRPTATLIERTAGPKSQLDTRRSAKIRCPIRMRPDWSRFAYLPTPGLDKGCSIEFAIEAQH